MPTSTDVNDVSGWHVLTLVGEIDVSQSPRLRQRFLELISTGHRRIVVDMDEVTLIDSTGLGVLVGALKRLHQGGGEIRLVATAESVLRVLRMTGLHHVFRIYSSVAAAVQDDREQ